MKKLVLTFFVVSISLIMTTFAYGTTANQVTGSIQASLVNASVIKLTSGEAQEVQWKFLSGYTSGVLTISLIAEDGLEITSSKREFIFPVSRSGEYLIPASIKAISNGRRYVNFYVRYESESTILNGTTSAVFQVGSVPVIMKKASAEAEVSLVHANEEIKAKP